MAKKKEFTFDEERHIYRLGDEVLPSVTQIIKPVTNYDHIPPAILKKAADFGTASHKVVEFDVQGTLDVSSLDDALLSILNAWWAFEADHPEFSRDRLVTEYRMYHPRLKYAGTPDLIYDGLADIDIKTRDVNRFTDSMQLEACDRLWQNNGGTKGNYDHYVLELHRNGTYRLVDVKDKQAWGRFNKLLEYRRLQDLIKQWKGESK